MRNTKTTETQKNNTKSNGASTKNRKWGNTAPALFLGLQGDVVPERLPCASEGEQCLAGPDIIDYCYRDE